ncbi:MAG: hypothetical protein R3B57_06280 [Phycisphaerales bacterium]
MPQLPDAAQARDDAPVTSEQGLEGRVIDVGGALLGSMGELLRSLPTPAPGPQALAMLLRIDKVLASRVLKMTRAADGLEAIHRAPGPEPMRRVIRACERAGSASEVTDRAREAVDNFERLIRHEAGDRSALDAVLSAWVPEARREFEVRRKQAAFRAMSQLKGAQTETLYAGVFLHPGADLDRIDIAWLNALFGVQRLRPGATVKLAARWMRAGPDAPPKQAIPGDSPNASGSLLLERFCSTPMPPIAFQRVGEVTHCVLGGDSFGASASADVVFAELGAGDMPRYVPREANRKRYVYAEVSVPAKTLVLDAFVHKDLVTRPAELRIYDTAFDGVASANDPTRDIDRLDLAESVESLGRGIARARAQGVPRHAEMTADVCQRLAWDPQAFEVFRTRIDYPLYGSQVTITFPTRERGEG